MLIISTVDYLVKARKADASALISKKRYAASVYLVGYAVELALKKRLCVNFNFAKGFPESKAELTAYGSYPFAIKDIKTHQLDKLLFYSGREAHIKTSFSKEWDIVKTWDSEQRYQKLVIKERKAKLFIASANKIIKAVS